MSVLLKVIGIILGIGLQLLWECSLCWLLILALRG